jgi:phosphosulfolactate synthase
MSHDEPAQERNPVMLHSLLLPARQAKPRDRGLTMVIDNGVPNRLFEDVIESSGRYIDLIKFGWCTALVTPGVAGKIATLQRNAIPFMFGGTLFEKHIQQGRFEDYRALCLEHGCQVVEVSNGTIDLDHEEKARYISKLAPDFEIISEVGFKDHPRSEMFAPSQWVSSILRDLDAGARSVILEARESGTSGICRPDGEIRFGLIEDVLGAGLDVTKLIFETPTKAMQTYFIKRIGSEVNLGNIAMTDIIGVETLRLGLRAETLLAFGEQP